MDLGEEHGLLFVAITDIHSGGAAVKSLLIIIIFFKILTAIKVVSDISWKGPALNTNRFFVVKPKRAISCRNFLLVEGQSLSKVP